MMMGRRRCWRLAKLATYLEGVESGQHEVERATSGSSARARRRAVPPSAHGQTASPPLDVVADEVGDVTLAPPGAPVTGPHVLLRLNCRPGGPRGPGTVERPGRLGLRRWPVVPPPSGRNTGGRPILRELGWKSPPGPSPRARGRVAPVAGQHLDPGPTRRMRGARMNTSRSGPRLSPSAAGVSASKDSRAAVAVGSHGHVDQPERGLTWLSTSRASTIRPAHVPNRGRPLAWKAGGPARNPRPP